MNLLMLLVGLVFILERLVKQALVMRFFARPIPALKRMPELVSILQPVVSGDPSLPEVLASTLTARSRFHREFLWLGDEDDAACASLCAAVMAAHPDADIRYVALPPAPQGYNPKTFKLANCANMARGDILCVLDDDTALPDDALESCLPYLDQPGVGLAFGLPYYVSFTNVWSSLTAIFVDSTSLLTSIPYAMLTPPFTINSMFYAMRRQTLARIGGFVGLERYLADDFAIAQRMRERGYRLAQTPLRHAIRTQVVDGTQYLRLLWRWFIAPRESVMRHLTLREGVIFYALGVLPSLYPLLAVILLFAEPTRMTLGVVFVFFALSFAIFAFNNWRYLGNAVPWNKAWLLPLVQVLTSIQIIVALLLPQRVYWRGNVMQIERGGTFRYLQRRGG
jgi:ceramide glucosyltransferase